MCVSRSTSLPARCARSPRPVRVTGKTSCPSERRRAATSRHAQPPRHAPGTRTSGRALIRGRRAGRGRHGARRAPRRRSAGGATRTARAPRASALKMAGAAGRDAPGGSRSPAPVATPAWARDTARVSGDPRKIALSQVIGALSYALDVTEGEPAGHAVRSCQIGMRLAQELELDAATRSQLFYALLLKDAGCSANSAKMAALFGADDHVAKRSSKRVDWSGRLPALAWSVRTVAPGGSARARLDRLLAIKAEGEVTRALMQARCDRGAEIALMLGLEIEAANAIRALDEHWDGGGQPRGSRGDEIPLLGRILCLAQTAEIFHAAGGVRAAWRVARRRRGRWFDPALVDAFGTLRADTAFWESLAREEIASWE